MVRAGWGLFGVSISNVVTALIYFICPTKFSNSALLFGSYSCCVGLRVIVFFNFRSFRSTPCFRYNAQLFLLFAEFKRFSLSFHFGI